VEIAGLEAIDAVPIRMSYSGYAQDVNFEVPLVGELVVLPAKSWRLELSVAEL
jgi:hypothetical protein